MQPRAARRPRARRCCRLFGAQRHGWVHSCVASLPVVWLYSASCPSHVGCSELSGKCEPVSTIRSHVPASAAPDLLLKPARATWRVPFVTTSTTPSPHHPPTPPPPYTITPSYLLPSTRRRGGGRRRAVHAAQPHRAHRSGRRRHPVCRLPASGPGPAACGYDRWLWVAAAPAAGWGCQQPASWRCAAGPGWPVGAPARHQHFGFADRRLGRRSGGGSHAGGSGQCSCSSWHAGRCGSACRKRCRHSSSHPHRHACRDAHRRGRHGICGALWRGGAAAAAAGGRGAGDGWHGAAQAQHGRR